MYTLFFILFFIVITGVFTSFFLHQDKFGELPSGERLERIRKSPFYKDGQFQNLSKTTMMAEGVNYFSLLKKQLFSKRTVPVDSIPAIKTNLSGLASDEDVMVWFGHSSYFIQLDGKKILVDPVLSQNASPVSFTTKAFKGTDIYTADDIPGIDYLFITHDHWDHLDYETVMMLKPRIGKVVCGLGVGEHFQRWGFEPESIIEMQWDDVDVPDTGFTIHCLPTRHFSGRGLKRNQSLWVSYMVQTPTFKFYIGGDGGYDTYYTKFGETFGPIDLAILENGQYDMDWRYIHMLPEQVLQTAKDLRARRLMPVHSSKFSLSCHPWDEPLKRITAANQNKEQDIITPKIGEVVNLKDSTQVFEEWWVGVN